MACRVCGCEPVTTDQLHFVEHCAQCLDDARALARLRKWREAFAHREFEIFRGALWHVELIEFDDEVARCASTLSAAADAALKAWEGASV